MYFEPVCKRDINLLRASAYIARFGMLVYRLKKDEVKIKIRCISLSLHF